MIFKKIQFIFKAEHSREEGKPSRACISWLTPLVTGVFEAEPGGNQEAGTPVGFPRWMVEF